MKKPKRAKLKLNKVKISKIQNSALLFGGSLTDPDEASGTNHIPQTQDNGFSCPAIECATLGAGEVTDPDGNNNQVGTNNSQ